MDHVKASESGGALLGSIGDEGFVFAVGVEPSSRKSFCAIALKLEHRSHDFWIEG
jgi:hypothetical protein